MVIPEKIHSEFILIKAAFESGSIKKMSELEKQKPTRIAKLIGMNQGRYGAKLLKPADFTPSEIIRISLVINVDAGCIINVIKNELLESEIKRITVNIKKLTS
jgi:hypothetical protein